MTSKTKEKFLTLYQLAKNLKKLKPWDVLEEDQIFVISHPHTGVKGYCSITGSGGEHFSLTIYRQESGLQSFYHLRETLMNERHEAPPLLESTMNLMQDYLMCSFEDKDMLFPTELERLDTLGLRFRGANNWPQFKINQPGCLPSVLFDEDDLDFFIVAIERTLGLIPLIKKKKLHIPPLTESTSLLQVGPEMVCYYEALDLEKVVDASYHSIEIDPFTLHKIKRMKTDGKLVLEGGLYILPAPPYDYDGAMPAIFPLFMGFYAASEPEVSFTLFTPTDQEASPFSTRTEALIQSFIKWLISLKNKPSLIVAEHIYSYTLLEPICTACEISLTLRPLSEATYSFFVEKTTGTLMSHLSAFLPPELNVALDHIGHLLDSIDDPVMSHDEASQEELLEHLALIKGLLSEGEDWDDEDDFFEEEEDFFEEDFGFYANEVTHTIQAFLDSPSSGVLLPNEREHAPFMLSTFCEMMYDVMGEEPYHWSPVAVGHWSHTAIPALLSAPLEDIACITPILCAYFNYLQQTKRIRNGKRLVTTITQAQPVMLKNAKDPANWNISKTIAMSAMAQGIDIEDPLAMKRFINDYNNQLRRNDPLSTSPHQAPIININKKVGRNSLCPCGSGKKYKHCCGK